jgi:hypothetical protein
MLIIWETPLVFVNYLDRGLLLTGGELLMSSEESSELPPSNFFFSNLDDKFDGVVPFLLIRKFSTRRFIVPLNLLYLVCDKSYAVSFCFLCTDHGLSRFPLFYC